MKKYFIFAATALVALVSCAKTATNVEIPQMEIGFQVAKYMNTPGTKASTGSVYNESLSFGSWAIYTSAYADPKDDFMANVEVAKSGSAWKPASATYYWPKTGQLDFVSVSPYAATPWIKPLVDNHAFAKLETSDYVTPAHTYGDSEDLMYSDVALACTNNVDLVSDGTNAFSGVPTFFRHALAKLNFKVKLAYDSAEDNTTWEVTINSLSIANVKQTGVLSLNGYDANGKWNLPDPAVWTPNSDKASIALISSATALTTTESTLVSDYYVMPQAIDDDVTFKVNFTIVTKRSGVEFITENIPDKEVKLNIATSGATAIENWEMAHNYTYIINLAPSKATDENGDGLEDTPIEIAFDPAVADWSNVNANINITF